MLMRDRGKGRSSGRGRVRGSVRGRQTVVCILAQLRPSKAQHPPQSRLLLLFLICCCCCCLFLGARFAAHPPSKTNRRATVGGGGGGKGQLRRLVFELFLVLFSFAFVASVCVPTHLLNFNFVSLPFMAQ